MFVFRQDCYCLSELNSPYFCQVHHIGENLQELLDVRVRLMPMPGRNVPVVTIALHDMNVMFDDI